MSHTTTTVVTKQASTGQTIVTTGNREWHSRICQCNQNCKNAVFGAFCSPCLACMLSKRVGEHACAPCVAGIHPMRLKTRLMLGIKGSICEDWCLSLFCGPCSLCQMSRELDAAGWPK